MEALEELLPGPDKGRTVKEELLNSEAQEGRGSGHSNRRGDAQIALG